MYLFFCFLIIAEALFSVERGWGSLDLAKAYFQNSELQRSWAWRLIKQIPLKGAERVLDFGCGDGKITAELSCLLREGEILGIDLSENMIQLANIHFPKKIYDNLHFIHGSAKEIGKEHRFDVIFAFSVFHFIEHPVDVLLDLKGHLGEGGKLVLSIPSSPSSVMRFVADEMFVKYHISPPWNLPNYSSKLSMRTEEGCIQNLIEAGYEIVFMQKVDAPMIFHDEKECIDWFVGTVTANWGIPFDLSHLFFTDLIRRMQELDPQLKDEEGCFSFPGYNLQVIAQDSRVDFDKVF